jgi:CRP/FNR family cyclic AMP-dependent transcriptional regulator
MKHSADLDDAYLRAMPLFRDLSPDELDRVRRLLHPCRHPARARVIGTEDASDAAYIVLAGAVKVVIERADGAEVILAILGPGEPVGEMSMVDRLERSAAVIALEELTLASMTRADFRRCLEAMPAMALNLLGIMSRRLRLADGQIEALAALDVEGRLARRLVDFAQEYGEPILGPGRRIPFRLTQQDLASLVGASRVRVNQILGDLRQRGCIDVDDRGRIVVFDEAGLSNSCP